MSLIYERATEDDYYYYDDDDEEVEITKRIREKEDYFESHMVLL